MAAHASIQPDAAMTNQFKLEIEGLPAIVFTSTGELATELELATMPDGTRQSTGKTKPSDTEVKHMAHHAEERIAMEAWFAQCIAGSPTGKRPGFLHLLGADGRTVKASYALDGCLAYIRKLPELDSSTEGEGAMLTWSLSVDNVLPA